MVSWSDLPYDVRYRILSEFVEIALDEYTRRRQSLKRPRDRVAEGKESDWEDDDSESECSEEEDFWEDYWDNDNENQNLPARLRSLGPSPLAWFVSTLRVSHDFYDIFNRITIEGSRAPETMKRAQCELFSATLEVYGKMYNRSHGQFYACFDDVTKFVGNVWKNYDCFHRGEDVLTQLHHIFDRCGGTCLPFLFPFFQHLSENVPSNEAPIRVPCGPLKFAFSNFL
jgi:hypothetical protein